MRSRIELSLVAALAVVGFALQPGCRPSQAPGAELPGGGDEVAEEPGARDDAGHGGDSRSPPVLEEPGEAELLVGQHCPEGAGGRPAIKPLFALAGSWSADDELLARIVAGGEARELAVLGWDGRRVGVMSAAGAANVGGERLLIGSYMGAPPCAREAPLGEEAEPEMACMRALGGCGVALGRLEKAAGDGARPYGERDLPDDLPVGGACIVDRELVVDLDGAGAAGFPLEGFAAGEVPDELLATKGPPGSCEPSFALESSIGDTRVDVIAVADLDQSGRADVLVATGEGETRAWTLYSATSTPARLDRVATAPATLTQP